LRRLAAEGAMAQTRMADWEDSCEDNKAFDNLTVDALIGEERHRGIVSSG